MILDKEIVDEVSVMISVKFYSTRQFEHENV